MLYQTDDNDYTLKTTNNLQTIRPFPDPSFPFTIKHLHMSNFPSPYLPWHWHDELECVWVKSGTLIVNTPDRTIILRTGEGLFLTPGMLHMMQTESVQDCEVYSIRFYSKLLFPDSASTLATQYLHPLLMVSVIKHIHLTDNGSYEGRILQIMKHLTEIYFDNQLGCELLILSHLYALWAELTNYAHQYSELRELTQIVMNDFKRISDAIHYIAEHYAESITLDDIASSIHLSKSECCRCFKRSLALSPVEFLIQYRIMESIRRMQTKEAISVSISDLAASVGFNSASYFNKQFKRYIHFTPLEYRKKLLSGISETDFEKEFKYKLTNPLETE